MDNNTQFFDPGLGKSYLAYQKPGLESPVEYRGNPVDGSNPPSIAMPAFPPAPTK